MIIIIIILPRMGNLIFLLGRVMFRKVDWVIDWSTNFNSMSNHLGLFYA